VAVLAFGAVFAAVCHLLRYYASWYHQGENAARSTLFRFFYLLSAWASLGAFVIGILVVVASIVCAA
jgi:hypothetical protein